MRAVLATVAAAVAVCAWALLWTWIGCEVPTVWLLCPIGPR